MPKTRETPISLDDIIETAFRPGSRAQAVARILADGRPHSRESLAEEADVSASTVPRAVGVLKREGVNVLSMLGPDGRSVTFQIADAAPGRESRATGSSRTEGDATTVEVVAQSERYSMTIHPDGSVTVRTPRSSVTID